MNNSGKTVKVINETSKYYNKHGILFGELEKENKLEYYVVNIDGEPVTFKPEDIMIDIEATSEESCTEYEMVDHPKHYRPGVYEAINVIEAWDLNFSLGSAVKYISRCGLKPDASLDDKMKAAEDLRKAAWYCNREADRIIQEKTVKNS